MARGLVPGFSEIQELSPARETAFRMTLNDGPRVHVRIESADGKPLIGARMSARWNDGPWIPVSLIQAL